MRDNKVLSLYIVSTSVHIIDHVARCGALRIQRVIGIQGVMLVNVCTGWFLGMYGVLGGMPGITVR